MASRPFAGHVDDVKQSGNEPSYAMQTVMRRCRKTCRVECCFLNNFLYLGKCEQF
jgi:hypothetical protein